ncbi:MAG: proprotein convertase P-domain-containing protein [Krumholzibacteria bacterium]|nr:proprotein convertase P-domain-containing protein [Candidatus Krumholzibacteria bacterium]
MMSRKMFIGLLVLSTCAAGAAHADILLSDGAPALAVTRDGKAELAFRVEVGRIQTIEVDTKGGVFVRLVIPGFHASRTEGAPELPMMNRLIAIPAGAAAQVDVRNVVTRRLKLADHGVVHPVMPAQPSLSKSADPARVPFVRDTAAYLQAEVRQPVARVVGQGRLRAMDVGRLEISPVAYFPASNEIEVIESMDVTVTFAGADALAATDLIARTWSPFFEHLYAGMAGAKGFHDDYPDRVGDVVTMVIVTPPLFASQLADFAAWKTERGFNVVTAVTGTPEVGTTAAQIQAYLHGLYNAGTPELPAPSFVVLVGDVAQMPTFTLDGDATDRPYCAVDGDLVPDMYYGRLSATNAAQLQAQLDKTMMYDQFTMPDPGYLDNVTLIAGVDGTWAPTHGNGQINYGTAHYFNASHGLTSNTYLYPASNGPVEGAIIQSVNDGVALINYTAHGSQTSWADPAMSQADVNGMTNSGKYALAIGNCCLTSTYDYGECFGETWLRAPDKGGIGYIGGSNSTYWDEDYWWGVGFHSSSQIDGTAWPYEATGLGAYDGVFHDHGEDAHLWYVTNDAIIFAGNLAVMESGSSRIEYYWNIYNLLGDPSLSTYLAPTANSVAHPSTVFVGTPALGVAADPGSYVGLTQGGVLLGAGTVGAGGTVDITYLEEPTPGVPLKLVVTAQNRVPYITELDVVVPATVTIVPAVIDVNTPTQVTVTVLDAGGVVPQPGIEIWAEGLAYATLPVVTDAAGVAVLEVTAAYGPSLDIVGQDPAQTYRLFTEPVAVDAAELTAPDLAVTTDIGLADAFALNLPGTLHATVGETGHVLYAAMPDGSLLDTAAADLTVTPDRPGQVEGIIAVSGYDLYRESFAVIEAFGTVAGTVTGGGSPLAGVTVVCVAAGGGTVFSVVTDGDGAWAAPDEVLVDGYTLEVDHFGYLPYVQPVFVGYGANTFAVELIAAPSGDFAGVVIDAVDFSPLQGTIRVFRSDTGELYRETTCAADGSFSVAALPYFTYNVQARAYHHVPVNLAIAIEQPETIRNFALEPTSGDLLVIDDGSDKSFREAKYGGKQEDVLLADAYVATAAKSAAQIAIDLEGMGFYAVVEPAATVDPATFRDYDLVVLACGDNTETLQNTVLKAALVDFAEAGGRLLLEGGELGYDHYGDAEFAAKVMHTNDWNADNAGTIAVNDAGAHILNDPNAAAVPLGLIYAGYGDSDAMTPLPDAARPLSWTGYPADASVITYDPNPAPEGGQIVFFTFNYLAVDAGRTALLENAVHWLMRPEAGDCSISGQALLLGETDHAGITVTATPNGGVLTTGPDGGFSLDGLYAGTYTVTAAKPGWLTQVLEITLAEGQDITGVSLVLTPTTVFEACSSPALPLPDYTTVTDAIVVGQSGSVGDVAVFVDVTHTWRGDLIATLTSPSGTQVQLHNRGGSSADDLHGWYPDEIVPVGDLGVFTGEPLHGAWTLAVSDNAGGDVGTFSGWCLRITYGGGPVAVAPEPSLVPQVFALHGNHPNPFNPTTTIRFDLPRPGHVRLDVFDVAGRLVRTLVDEYREGAVHAETWDGTDNSGRRAASGVYYCRVVADGNAATAKMLLLK